MDIQSGENVVDSVKQKARSAGADVKEKVQNITRDAKDQAVQMWNQARSRLSNVDAKQMANDSLAFVNRNKVPLLLVGAGLSWYVFSQKSKKDIESPKTDDMTQNNALALGLGAFALGALAGVILPRPDAERRLMRRAADGISSLTNSD